jgi:hypothetical protein
MPDYLKEVQRALGRQRAASDSRRELDRVAARMPAGALSCGDIADIVRDALTRQRHEIVQHVQRMMQLLETTRRSEDVRAKNLHARITTLESELRMLKKGAPQ